MELYMHLRAITADKFISAFKKILEYLFQAM